MDPLRIYDYLAAARRRLLDAVRTLTPEEYLRPFPFGLTTVGATVTHMMLSEWYYIERVEGREVPPYERWPIQYENPPSLTVIEPIWREQEVRVRSVLAAQTDAVGADGSRGWDRRIAYESFPDDTRGRRRFLLCATAGDYVIQLALHEVHHRSQAMSMLRQLGQPVQDIDYNDLMFERRELS